MDLFDIRTIILSHIITNVICLVVMVSLWLRNRDRFAGLGFWSIDFVFQFMAILLIALRSIVPDYLSIVLGNTLVIAGTVLLYIGLEHFADKRTSQTLNYFLLTAFIFLHIYFTLGQPSLLMRTINLTVAIILLCLQCAWLLLYRVDADLRPITRGVGYVFLALCLFSIARVAINLVVDPGNDFFQSGIFEALAVLINQMLIVILTFGLMLMVNRRLIADLEQDIVQREQMKEVLQFGEEKFYKAFHSSPDAILISKLSDGRLVEVNDGFAYLTGFSREEALGSSSINLHLWANLQDRDSYIRVLQANQRVRDREYDFRTKSGNIRTGVFSGEIIQLGDEPHILTVVRDITEHRLALKALHESEKRYRSLFENMLSGYAYCKMMYAAGQPEDFTFLQVNSAFEKLTGVGHVAGKRASEVLPGMRETAPELFEVCQRVSATGQSEQFETYMDVLENWFFISVYGREPEYFVLIFENITERKLLEASLHYRNDILAASHQVMLDLVNRHSVDDILQTLLVKISVLLDVSDVSIDLVENKDTLVTYAATSGQPLAKGDTVRRGEAGWLSWQAVDTGQPAILDDYSTWSQRRELYEGFPIHAIAIVPIHHRSHVIGTINFSRREANKPFTDVDVYVTGQLAQMVALVLDNAGLYAQLQSELAERKRVDESLRDSQENFQRYFNMSTVGMCVTSPDRRWIETNGRMRQMLGYSAEELDTLTWSDITYPDDLDTDLALYNQILANERDSYQLDKRFVRKDGSLLYTTLFVTCHRNPDGTLRYFLASLVDITDRKLAEGSVLKLATIEERQRLARDLHDSVNQSIHGLVLFSETLVSTLEKNNLERARQIAARLQESAYQALKETRLMLYEMQSLDPERDVDLIRDLETRLATVEQRAGIKAQIFQEGSLDHCPRVWYENLFWITIEALNNALKHALARNVQIRICCFPDHMELEVIDDGVGFDPNKPRAGGLGLKNMHDRASLIGGELTILSTPHQGSRVRFRAEVKE